MYSANLLHPIRVRRCVTLTDDMHIDSDTEENEGEDDLEPEDGENASNNPRIRKQNKKAYFRITSVVDTIKNESEHKHEDPSSKIPKENEAKNSLDLENSADTPDNKGGKVNTEDDTEEKTKIELNLPSKFGPPTKSIKTALLQ